MKRIILLCFSIFITLPAGTIAQETTPTLAAFFQQRLAGVPPPSYDALLRVIDPIANSDPKDLATALPFLSAALKSTKDNLAVEAAFGFYEIAKRPDAGTLLRSRVPEIGALLELPDNRLGGSSVLTLRFLTPSNGDLTVPIMIRFLSGPAKPSIVKAEIVSTLIKFRHDDPIAMKAINAFFTVQAETPVRIATLQALSANHLNAPGIDDFAVHSLGDPNKFVKIAAIHAVHALGPEVWSRAQPAVTRLATDPSEDKEVRTLADRELRDTVVSAPQ